MKKKITLSKDDTAKDLAGYIGSESAEYLIFIIPKFSSLSGSPEAFVTAKKIAEAMGKTVAIESVDDGILASAQAAGLSAENPFFSNDGIPAWEKDSEPAPAHFADGPQEDAEEGVVATPVVARIRPTPKPIYRRKIESDDDDRDFAPKKKRGFFGNPLVWVVGAVVVLIPSYWVAFYVLPRADIVITTHKESWDFNDVMTFEKNGPVPTIAVTDKKNAQMSFPALGKKVVNQKAAGKIIVYNGYSSQPQQLVATTRFEAADGSIVRLVKSITIPGAKVDGGTITPSSIEAEVIADKPGPSYNIVRGKLSIPGFKGTAKFAGFYGEVTTALTGGFVGEAAYPTDDDVKSAKAKIAEVLQNSLMSQLASKVGKDYVIVPGSAQLVVTKTSINPQANAQGEFSLFAEAELKAIAFKESDLVGYFAILMKEKFGNPTYTFKETRITYDSPKPDFAAQKLVVSVDFKGVAELPIDIALVRGTVAGKSLTELKVALFAVPGIDSSVVTLRPGYVRRVPRVPTVGNVSILLK